MVATFKNTKILNELVKEDHQKEIFIVHPLTTII